MADFTEPSLLVPELLNETQESTIAELSKRLKDAGRVGDMRAFSCAVLKHESLVSTVFDDVAFSLARRHTALELSFAIGLSEYGIRWGKPIAPVVFTVVLFAIPDTAEKEYLSLIMTFSTLLKNRAFFPILRESKHPEEMFELLARTGLRKTGRN
jgi:mannitol/fructose-specific phosphotransferase system IIA component (Ntr-type)